MQNAYFSIAVVCIYMVWRKILPVSNDSLNIWGKWRKKKNPSWILKPVVSLYIYLSTIYILVQHENNLLK